MDKETSEIDKLTERILKDPRSKLFVPLAEEYKKAGDIEMAIHVLLEGINNNPGYITARSFLGKLLLAKGDLAGAQKEFEEVVKTVPDNLMARRKLGDLFILQNRPSDALTHYKIARSLNPGDKEFASLILDVEAGRDVRPQIQQLTMKSSVEQAVKQEPPASAAAPGPMPGSVPPLAQKAVPITSTEIPVAPPLTEAAAAPAPLAAETEEPEEVLIVEPLEPEGSAKGPSTTDSGFVEAVSVEDPGQALKEVAEKSDDFTTDTLAELYIAQGFYEKAVDIYEKMLADKPNSRGLQDKLAGVRAAAARTETLAAGKKGPDLPVEREAREYVPVVEAGAAAIEPSVFDGPKEFRLDQKTGTAAFKPKNVVEAREYVPPPETEERAIEAGLPEGAREFRPRGPSPEENIFAESREYKPATEPEQQPTAWGESGFDVAATSPVPERGRPKRLDTDYEPREYSPPKAGPEAPGPAREEARATPKPRGAGRKETIARLETWLTAIKKEK